MLSTLLAEIYGPDAETRHADPERRITIETLIEAGATRFKPIMLTALAAMIGAVVILADPIFQGLALSLLFGLLTSTALTRGCPRQRTT